MHFIFDPSELPAKPTQQVVRPAQPALPQAQGFKFGQSDTESPISTGPVSQQIAPQVIGRAQLDPHYATRRGINYVDQQRTIIESDHEITVGMALAGTGKTSTAVGFTDARPNLRTLYLAFNTENAAEGRRRFGSHVQSRTPHSIAFAALNSEQRARVTYRWNATTVRNALNMTNYRAAATVCAIINDFCVSDDEDFDPLKHGYSAVERLGVDHDMVVRCTGFARRLWQMMWTPGSGTPIPDDAYFKRFVMSRPNLGAQLVIFDEAQDANAVTAQLVRYQHECHGSRLLYLGDEHQSIYAFRGAINAMRHLPDSAHRYPLTQSWRFGPKTAALANLVLSEFKGSSLALEGMGADHPWDHHQQYAYLARTNAGLIAQAVAVNGQGVHWVGGIERYRVDLLLDVWRLSVHKHHEIQDRFISQNFDSWFDYEQAAHASGDPEMLIMVKLIDDYGDTIPQIVQELKANEQRQASNANLILTTAHRAKGLEFSQVRIGEDFAVCDQAEQWLAGLVDGDFPEQEANLLYVALTRAKGIVNPGSDMQQWLKELQAHRNQRKRAIGQPDQDHAGIPSSQPNTKTDRFGFGALSAPKF